MTPMKPIKLTFAFKKDSVMVARIIVAISLVLAGSFIAFAITYVLTTLNAAFDAPVKTSDGTTEEQAYLAPELIERVLTAQTDRLAPDAAIPADLYDPFAPIVVPATPTPVPTPVETPSAQPE